MPLNRREDGPFAYADAAQLTQYDATEWLIEAVEDNNGINDGTWSDWTSAKAIIDVYEPAHDGKKIMSYYDDPLEDIYRIQLGEKGRRILELCIAGANPDEIMTEWREQIRGQMLLNS